MALFRKLVCFLTLFSLIGSSLPMSFVSASGWLDRASDTISTSWPNVGANHTFEFKNIAAIPPSGKIEITPQVGVFEIPAGFNYTEVDMDISSDGVSYTERTQAAVASAIDDGVVVVTGNSGSVSIILNSSEGVSANSFFRIDLGTNATSSDSTSTGEIADEQLINPWSTGSFKFDIKTYNASNVLLDKTEVMIAIVEPVSMSASSPADIYPPVRYDGLPTGELVDGTTMVSMSLTTHEYAVCKYASTPNISFYDMPFTFDNNINGRLTLAHDTLVSDLVSGQSYFFYIRCRDKHNNMNMDDYLISFSIIEAAPPSRPGNTGGGGSGGGGGGGGGGGPQPPPTENPQVIIKGWAYPSSKVVILKNGVQEAEIFAENNAEFSYTSVDLTQGTYTFSVWAEDSDGVRSVTHSASFNALKGTKTFVSVVMPPTTSIAKNFFNPGEIVSAWGQALPNSTVEMWLSPIKDGKVTDIEAIKAQGQVDGQGKWKINYDTKDTPIGNYELKVKITQSVGGESNFGKAFNIGIGEEPLIQETPCQKSDINKDGKVNLVDFSILLFYWNTDTAMADINSDGKVNLVDFSIMLYCWTG